MATGFNVNSNISSMKTYRAFAHSQTKLEESIERLSTGLRINKASDDTEGAAIATRLSNRVRSLQKAQTNSKRTIDMLQTAEGSLNDIHNILARMRELAVQSASDNLNTKDRSTIDMEYQQLKSEIDRIAKSTEYNQIKLIDGSQKATVSTVTGVGIDSVSTAGHGGQKVSSGSYSFEYKPGSLKLVNKTTGEFEVVDFTPASAGEIKTYQFSSLGLTVSFDEEFDLNNVANSTFEVTATGSTVQIGADDDADSNLDFTLGDATAKGLRLSQSSLDNLASQQVGDAGSVMMMEEDVNVNNGVSLAEIGTLKFNEIYDGNGQTPSAVWTTTNTPAAAYPAEIFTHANGELMDEDGFHILDEDGNEIDLEVQTFYQPFGPHPSPAATAESHTFDSTLFTTFDESSITFDATTAN